MKAKTTAKHAVYVSAFCFMALLSCQKNDVSDETGAGTVLSSASASAIAVSASASSALTDSVYIVQPCAKGSKRDSVSFASLPASVSAYLSGNYAGYSFHKAFAIHNSAGATTGYAVIIYYNDNRICALFAV